MARHIKLLSLTIALALWPAAYAHAAEPQDTFSIRVSGYINEFDTTIEVDGDIAMVWAPYVFTLNGKVEHCGTNHFGLIREGDIWKIASIHWTQRKMGCSTI